MPTPARAAKKATGVRWKSMVELQAPHAPHTKGTPGLRAFLGAPLVNIKGAHTLPVLTALEKARALVGDLL